MKEKKADLPPFLLESTPWQAAGNPIWPASSFILHRNLARNFFPTKMTETQGGQVASNLKEALFKAPELVEPQLIKTDDVAPVDREFLFEHFLRLESFPSPAKSQGFVIDKSTQFLALFNIEDHLQLQLINFKGEWKKAWETLSAMHSALASKLEFAYSPRFGFLTSDPNICGTALIVHFYLHLPALIHTGQLQEALVKQKEESVIATSLQGSLDEIVGDFVILRNGFTLGLSEENILQALQNTAMKLVSFEKSLRTHVKSSNNPAIKDEVSRAYGLLLHSYQLQTKEALGALSLLKLGLDLGWIAGTSDSKLNEIFFRCRHAHLSHLFPTTQDPQELTHRRAEFLQQQLQGAELKI